MDRLEIYINKRKSVLLIFGAVICVCNGFILSGKPERFVFFLLPTTLMVTVAGIAVILFFGYLGYRGIQMYSRGETGLLLDSMGLTFDPRHPSTGFIDWKRITGFKVVQVQGQKIIIILLEHPEKLLELETRKFKLKIMQFSLENYGSPIGISANGLQITHEKLLDELNRFHAKYNSQSY